MTDSKSELVKDKVGGDQVRTMELDEPTPDEPTDENRRGGGDDKAKSLGGQPGLGEYGRPNRQQPSDG